MVRSIVLNYPERELVIFDHQLHAAEPHPSPRLLAEPVTELIDILWSMALLRDDYRVDISILPAGSMSEEREPLFQILDGFYKRNPKLMSITRFLAEKRMFPEACALDRLSPMQKKILLLIRKGHSYTAIADKLCISPHTVNGHRKNAMKILGVTNMKKLLSFLDRFAGSYD